MFPGALWNVKNAKSEIYLTFDDGPTLEVTPWVLEQLRLFDAKATFFCLGKRVDGNKEIFKEIVNDHHSTGHHTYDHVLGWKVSKDAYMSNVIKGNAWIRSPLFRPPYGKLSWEQYHAISQKYTLVMWDVNSYDYNQDVSAERCLKYLIRNTKPGSIVLFHDSEKSYKKLRYILPEFLEAMIKKNYTFHALETSMNYYKNESDEMDQ